MSISSTAHGESYCDNDYATNSVFGTSSWRPLSFQVTIRNLIGHHRLVTSRMLDRLTSSPFVYSRQVIRSLRLVAARDRERLLF